jgi:hypothetical protein
MLKKQQSEEFNTKFGSHSLRSDVKGIRGTIL